MHVVIPLVSFFQPAHNTFVPLDRETKQTHTPTTRAGRDDRLTPQCWDGIACGMLGVYVVDIFSLHRPLQLRTEWEHVWEAQNPSTNPPSYYIWVWCIVMRHKTNLTFQCERSISQSGVLGRPFTFLGGADPGLYSDDPFLKFQTHS